MSVLGILGGGDDILIANLDPEAIRPPWVVVSPSR